MISWLFLRTKVCKYVRMFICLCICVFVYVRVCMYVRICVRVSVWICVYVYMCVGLSKCLAYVCLSLISAFADDECTIDVSS